MDADFSESVAGRQRANEATRAHARMAWPRSTRRVVGASNRSRDRNNMERLQGIAVSPGVAIGEVLVMDNEGFRIPRRFLPRDAVEDELQRLKVEIAAATSEMQRHRDRVA